MPGRFLFIKFQLKELITLVFNICTFFNRFCDSEAWNGYSLLVVTDS